MRENQYIYQSGSELEMKGLMHATGHTPEFDVPQQVVELFNKVSLKVTRVIIVHDDLNESRDPKKGLYWSFEKVKPTPEDEYLYRYNAETTGNGNKNCLLVEELCRAGLNKQHIVDFLTVLDTICPHCKNAVRPCNCMNDE